MHLMHPLRGAGQIIFFVQKTTNVSWTLMRRIHSPSNQESAHHIDLGIRPSNGDTFRKDPKAPVLERTVCGVVYFHKSSP